MSNADAFRERLAAMMTKAGEKSEEIDGSDDYGYVQKRDTEKRIEVAWHNYCELEDFALDYYPDDSWEPGKLCTSSAAQDGIVKPEWLKDVKYILFFEIDDHVDEHGRGHVAIEAVRGLADTVEHAEDLIEWLDYQQLLPDDYTVDYREIPC